MENGDYVRVESPEINPDGLDIKYVVFYILSTLVGCGIMGLPQAFAVLGIPLSLTVMAILLVQKIALG